MNIIVIMAVFPPRSYSIAESTEVFSMFCPNCGQELSDEALFCGSCGFKIERESDVQPIEYPEQESDSYGDAEVYEQAPEDYAEQPDAYIQHPETPAQQPETPAQQPEAPAQQPNIMAGASDLANKAKAVGGEAFNKANAAADSATAAVQKIIPGVNKKILLIACAALIVVIVVLIVIFANLGGGSSPYTVIPHSVYSLNDDGDLALFIDGKAVTTDISYKSDSSANYAYNANALVYNGALYRVDGNKLNEINDSVKSVTKSVNQNALVYISDDSLYIYKNGKETLIYDDFNGSVSSSTIRISPNGNTVVFTDKDDDDYITYIYKGSSPEKIGKNIYPILISDDASALYAYKYSDGRADNTLYLYKNSNVENSVKIKSDVYTIADHSSDAKKVLFTTSSGTFYFAPNLADAVKVDSGSISPIYPGNTTGLLNDFRDFIAIDGTSVKRFMFRGDSYEKYSVASSISAYTLSLDGKKLVYQKGTKLYSISTTNESAEPTKIAEDVKSYYASSDLSKIYIINDDKELVFSDGRSEKTTKITDDVKTVCVSSNGVCCYVVDEVLYSTSGASKGAKVNKMSDVTSLIIRGGSVFYAKNDGILYVSTNGSSFEKTNVGN